MHPRPDRRLGARNLSPPMDCSCSQAPHHAGYHSGRDRCWAVVIEWGRAVRRLVVNGACSPRGCRADGPTETERLAWGKAGGPCPCHRDPPDVVKLRVREPTPTARLASEDPVDAVRSVVKGRQFDEIIVSTLPRRLSRWLHRDLARHSIARSGCRSPTARPTENASGNRPKEEKSWHASPGPTTCRERSSSA